MTELSRSARALGRNMNFFGNKDCDLVLQTKGKIKINFGDKFTDLFNGGSFSIGNKDVISTITSKPSTKDEDGFYFDKNSGTLYLKIGDNIYEILSNAKSIEGYIVYNDIQNLSKDEKFQAQNNIGISFLTKEDAINSQSEGLVYIVSENSVFILKNGTLYPIGGEGSEGSNFFKEQVTIDLGDSESLALLIEGLGNYIRVGTETNHTDIYQNQTGGVIDSNKQLTIKVDGKDQILVKPGEIFLNSILKALKGIITDEIYSSNFKEGSAGWGLWIDKATGESYLQVDHISAKVEMTPTYLRYQDALSLAVNGKIEYGTKYIIIDYQNEWEITTVSDQIGVNIVTLNGWHSSTDSVNPGAYDEDSTEPKFGVDRNVRPIVLIGKNNYQYETDISYYYESDNKDILEMKYDIRTQNYDGEKWPTEDNYSLLDLDNMGRIYHMRDIWNNEAPLDFKKYTKDGKHVFNSADNEDLSSLNSTENLVCYNNTIWDLNSKNAEDLDSIIITGTSITNNEFKGSFKNSTIGNSESIIQENTFSGKFEETDILGKFIRNNFKGNIIKCKFNKDVIGNVWNRDIENCTFNDIVENNTFNSSLLNCIFNKVHSNQLMGSMEDCTFNKGFNNNRIGGELKKCIFKGDVYSNTIGCSLIDSCTWEKSFFSNQITADSWKKNTFKDVLKYNIFQADVIKFICEGMVNNNQFIGRINNVQLLKDTNPSYGVNNNIINGSFIDSVINVDFSHNNIVGPISKLIVKSGNTGTDGMCLFNWNDITCKSINTLNINHDFRENTLKVDVINTFTTNDVFQYNTLVYNHFTNLSVNKVTYCTGSGLKFIGTFNNISFDNCNFKTIENGTFKDGEIAYANFRSDFTSGDFTSDSIKNLNILYDREHQVNIYKHKNEIKIECEPCNNIRGEIKMFSGTVADIPDGWHICDGTEGTPDLTDKFITAGTEVKEVTTGYTVSKLAQDGVMIKTSNLPTDSMETDSAGSHTHSCDGVSSGPGGEGSGGASASSSTTGSAGEHTHKFQLNSGSQEGLKVIPNYYVLIFIMKL